MSDQLADGWHYMKYSDFLPSVVRVRFGEVDGEHVHELSRRGYTLEPVVILSTAEHATLVQEAADDAAEAKHYREMVVRLEGRNAELEAQLVEAMAMLERRQRCEECNGSGALPFVDYAEDDVSMEPCLCWSDAEDLLDKYETRKAGTQ